MMGMMHECCEKMMVASSMVASSVVACSMGASSMVAPALVVCGKGNRRSVEGKRWTGTFGQYRAGKELKRDRIKEKLEFPRSTTWEEVNDSVRTRPPWCTHMVWGVDLWKDRSPQLEAKIYKWKREKKRIQKNWERPQPGFNDAYEKIFGGDPGWGAHAGSHSGADS